MVLLMLLGANQAIGVTSNGSLTITSGTYSGKNQAIWTYDTATATISGGTFTSPVDALCVVASSTMTTSGGTFYGGNCGIAIQMPNAKFINNGGSFSGGYRAIYYKLTP